MSDTEYKVGYGKPALYTAQEGRAFSQPARSAAENLAALLVDGLKKPVTVTENRRRRKGTVREAVVSHPIERLRTQVLSEMTCKSPG